MRIRRCFKGGGLIWDIRILGALRGWCAGKGETGTTPPLHQPNTAAVGNAMRKGTENGSRRMGSMKE